MSNAEISSSEIKGKEVVGPQGAVLGKVTEVNIDPNNWQVASFQVALDGKVAEAIGVKKRFGKTEMPLKSSFVGLVGEKVLVSASREDLIKYVTDLRIDQVTNQIKIPP
jgi:sporulation protein YlmC with PRC-barrel domain